MALIIRKAKAEDINAIANIYAKIHSIEEQGLVTIGWQRGVYPEKETAQAALKRDDLFVTYSSQNKTDKLSPARSLISSRLMSMTKATGNIKSLQTKLW